MILRLWQPNPEVVQQARRRLEFLFGLLVRLKSQQQSNRTGQCIEGRRGVLPQFDTGVAGDLSKSVHR